MEFTAAPRTSSPVERRKQAKEYVRVVLPPSLQLSHDEMEVVADTVLGTLDAVVESVLLKHKAAACVLSPAGMSVVSVASWRIIASQAEHALGCMGAAAMESLVGKEATDGRHN